MNDEISKSCERDASATALASLLLLLLLFRSRRCLCLQPPVMVVIVIIMFSHSGYSFRAVKSLKFATAKNCFISFLSFSILIRFLFLPLIAVFRMNSDVVNLFTAEIFVQLPNTESPSPPMHASSADEKLFSHRMAFAVLEALFMRKLAKSDGQAYFIAMSFAVSIHWSSSKTKFEPKADTTKIYTKCVYK